MREVIFRKQNKEKWKQIEEIFENRQHSSSDQLASSYIEVMNDLSFASTYFPNSRTHEYLNTFATKLHNLIYINKKEETSRFKQFWLYEVPLITRKHHRMFLYAFLSFLFFVLLGAFLQHFDPKMVRIILGDFYVDMTLDNIDKGDPMAVYKDMAPFTMFIYIFTNNFLVMLRCIAFGIFPILGTLYIVANNGVMVGAFLYFFIQQGLFWESFRTVFIHGTVELISIAIAGAGSFIIGTSILFPGTYTRIHSFTNGVKDAIKVCVGLVPFILIAAIAESYVTRYTGMPDWLAIFIILGSLLLMIFYYVIYPIQVDARFNRNEKSPILEVKDI